MSPGHVGRSTPPPPFTGSTPTSRSWGPISDDRAAGYLCRSRRWALEESDPTLDAQVKALLGGQNTLMQERFSEFSVRVSRLLNRRSHPGVQASPEQLPGAQIAHL